MSHHPTPSSEGAKRLARAVTQKVFRGQIYEDDADNPEVKDFIACHFHRKILRDALKPTTRRMGIRAANQVGKTTIMELIFKFVMKFFPADMLMWDMNEAKANDHMKNRYMPILRADPVLGPMFRKIAASPETRWNVCTTNILLPGMVFRARPLNEQWVQSFPAKYGGLSDAALVEASLVRKIEVRFTKYESSYLWVVESQGDAPMGNLGGGMAEFMAKTNEMKLNVRCPDCQTRVRFLFHHLRNDETKIVAPLSVPSLDREAWVATNRPILLSEERKHCGFKVLGELKHDDGSINEREIMKSTVYECPHCGGIWKDDNVYHSGEKVTYGPTRIYLDREAGLDENWIATRSTALPGFLGYSIPRWINPKPSWGAVMLTFKQAMAAQKDGNIMPLQEFKTKWEGEDWNDSAEHRKPNFSFSIGSYETNPENLSYGVSTMRQITVDTGKSPESDTNVIQIGQLFFEVRDFDNGAESLSRGASRQITRGMVQDCMMDAPDGRRRVSCWELLAAQQHYWRITNRHVLIDIGYAPSQVIEAAVKFHEIVDLNGKPVARENYGKQVDWASCWRGCQGSGDSRIGPAKKAFHESGIPGLQSTHDKSGRLRKISLSRIIWSNYAFEDQFERIVMLKTAAVGWEILAQDKLVIVGLDGKPNSELTQKYIEFEQDKEGSGQFRSWVSGLNSRTLDDKKRKYIDNAKQAYAKGHWTEPRDCSLMQLVGAAAEGMLGHVTTEE